MICKSSKKKKLNIAHYYAWKGSGVQCGLSWAVDFFFSFFVLLGLTDRPRGHRWRAEEEVSPGTFGPFSLPWCRFGPPPSSSYHFCIFLFLFKMTFLNHSPSCPFWSIRIKTRTMQTEHSRPSKVSLHSLLSEVLLSSAFSLRDSRSSVCLGLVNEHVKFCGVLFCSCVWWFYSLTAHSMVYVRHQETSMLLSAHFLLGACVLTATNYCPFLNELPRGLVFHLLRVKIHHVLWLDGLFCLLPSIPPLGGSLQDNLAVCVICFFFAF